MPRSLIVTGGGRGIGRAIVESLVTLGHSVVVLARDPDHARSSLAEVQARGPGVIQVVRGDLGTLAGVEASAAALHSACPRLDVLIHNAGLWPTSRTLNADGFEQSFATNHLAPLLLSHRLLDRLRASGGRIVQVSAGLYVRGRADLERTPTGADFSQIRTYADTKLCNLLCTKILARELAPLGITVNATHPGVIRTDLGAAPGVMGWALRQIKRRWDPPEVGARSPVHLALAPELERVTGRYFDQLKEVDYDGPALDEALAEAVYAQAMSLTGLSQP